MVIINFKLHTHTQKLKTSDCAVLLRHHLVRSGDPMEALDVTICTKGCMINDRVTFVKRTNWFA